MITNFFLIQLTKKVKDIGRETWFITDGIDSGLTSLLGTAVNKNRCKNAKVIGFSSWCKIYNNKRLLQLDRHTVNISTYPIKKDNSFTQMDESLSFLNKDHSHFFLVDSENGCSIQDVIRFKLRLLDFIGTHYKNEGEIYFYLFCFVSPFIKSKF